MTRQRTCSVFLFALAALAFTALGFAAVGAQTPPAAQTPDAQQGESTPPPVGAESGSPADADDEDGDPPPGDDDQATQKAAKQATSRLLSAQIVLAALVLLALPAGAWINGSKDKREKRGLGLPRGSVRAMLALLIVGSTINLLLFGSAIADLATIIGTLNTLTAAVIGFYFGGRTSAPTRKNSG